MKLTLTFDDIQQAAQDFLQQYGGSCQRDNQETVLHIPKRFGQGCMRGVNLRRGLDLLIHDYTFNSDIILDCQQLSVHQSVVNLGFCLSGNYSGTMPEFKRKLELSAWQTGFATVPHAVGVIELPQGERLTVVELVMSPAFARRMLKAILPDLPAAWRRSLSTKDLPPFCHTSRLSPDLWPVLQNLLNCPYRGTLRQLYLEGKSLELIARYFDGLTTPSHKKEGVKRKDVDCLHEARHILFQNIDDPPSINRLAKQVGLSERGLQKGFQQLFGTTVCGVLHNFRMEQAKTLLESGEMNVGAIASTVGINHRGHFSMAFKRKFGTTPSAYLKQMRQ